MGLDGCTGGGGIDRLTHGCYDSVPPQLLDFSASPRTIDTADGPQTITFRAHLTDDFSGVNPNRISLSISQPNGDSAGIVGGTPWTLISGTERDGIWESTHTLGQYAVQGTYRVDFVTVDRAANGTHWTPTRLTDAGFPGTIQNG